MPLLLHPKPLLFPGVYLPSRHVKTRGVGRSSFHENSARKITMSKLWSRYKGRLTVYKGSGSAQARERGGRFRGDWSFQGETNRWRRLSGDNHPKLN